MLPERYDPGLVAASYVIATLGSITALRLGARVGTQAGRLRMPWLVGGALAQGMGVWAMHFTGMLALALPVPVAYDVPLILLSYAVASLGALLALFLTQRRSIRPRWMTAGALSIGAGISGLHFIDMAAMRMAAAVEYSAPLVVLSIAIACVFGLLSLRIGRRHRRDEPGGPRWRMWAGGAVMGLAIVGQHYTGMAAARFVPAPPSMPSRRAVPAGELPRVVLLSTFAILGVALAAAAADRRRDAHALLSRRLLAAQEDERRRIARGLHDDIGQSLTALRLNLQRLAPSGNDAPIVADSISLVDDALTRVRALSVELRPSVLDDLGLGAAVSWYARRSGERAGFEVSIENTLGAARLAEAIETAGFRIVQQALTNVARHAGARRVSIELARGPHDVVLAVTDDGIGFDVHAARARAESGESLGLLHMQEMAALAGGMLSLTSAAGRGTTVRVRFPLGA